jgi:phage shock protein E
VTKHKKSDKKPVNNKLMLGAVFVAIVLMMGAVFLFSGSGETGSTVSSQPQNISPQDYQSTYLTNNTDHILLDVRTPEEFASGYIAGAINIAVQELNQRLSEIPTDKDIVIYCRSGNRSAQAATILSNNGFDDVYDMGGIIDWQQAGYSLES